MAFELPQVPKEAVWPLIVYVGLQTFARIFAPYILERLKSYHEEQLRLKQESQSELERLRAEVAQLRMENALLRITQDKETQE